MKCIRADKPRIRRERAWTQDPPADPRDPDVVRAKALACARLTGSSRASQAQAANTSGPGANIRGLGQGRTPQGVEGR